MKFWFTFVSGVVLGALAGAFLTSFFLFDDVRSSSRPQSVAARPAIFKAKKEETPIIATAPQKLPEEKPSAVSAEAVNFDTLNAVPAMPSPENHPVMSTAKRENTSIDP